MEYGRTAYALVYALTDLQKPTIRTVLSGSYRPIGNSIAHAYSDKQK